MARDSEYEALLNRYNLAMAQVRDLNEQAATKDRQWREYESKCEVTFGHIRKLCESILAKDKREMVLGNAKTWDSFSNDELISKAQKSFVQYNKERTELLNKIMNIAEDRSRKIESLEDQISQAMLHGNVGALSVDEMLEKADKDKREKEAKDKVPNAIKAAVASGKVDLIVDEMDSDENEQVQALLEKQVQKQLAAPTAPVARGAKKLEQMRKNEKKAVLAHMVDLGKYIEKCSDAHWQVLEIMGKEGKSKLSDIITELAHDESAPERKYRGVAMELISMGAIEKEEFSLPLTRHAFFVQLSDIGYRLFKEHFDEDPVESEIKKVCAEHDNAIHGYGILDVEQMLNSTERYTNISSSNRKNPITVTVGGQKLHYIPDLICKHKEGYTEYIEYECAHHTQMDFNIKCNKMCQVTKYLNFVCPNKEAMIKVQKQVNAWVEARGVESLKTITLRIATATGLRDNGDWTIVYKFSKGANPIRDYN